MNQLRDILAEIKKKVGLSNQTQIGELVGATKPATQNQISGILINPNSEWQEHFATILKILVICDKLDIPVDYPTTIEVPTTSDDATKRAVEVITHGSTGQKKTLNPSKGNEGGGTKKVSKRR